MFFCPSLKGAYVYQIGGRLSRTHINYYNFNYGVSTNITTLITVYRQNSSNVWRGLDDGACVMPWLQSDESAHGLRYPLTGYAEVLTNLFEGVIRFLTDTKAHTQHFLFALAECRQHIGSLIGKVAFNHRFKG